MSEKFNLNEVCAICGDTFSYHSAQGDFCPNQQGDKPHFVETKFVPVNKQATEVANASELLGSVMDSVCNQILQTAVINTQP